MDQLILCLLSELHMTHRDARWRTLPFSAEVENDEDVPAIGSRAYRSTEAGKTYVTFWGMRSLALSSMKICPAAHV